MALTLTKDEFLERLNERSGKGGILEIAIKRDLKLNKAVKQEDFIVQATIDALFRVIDAVYADF